MEKKWSILIIPNTSEQGYNINVTATALKLCLVGFSLLLLTGFVSCFASVHAWKKGNAHRVEKLQDEVAARDKDLGVIKKELIKLISLEEKLRAIAGLKPRHPAISEISTGGRGGPESNDLAPHESTEHSPAVLLSRVSGMDPGGLLEAILATHDSFTEILETFEKEQQRLANVPSINPVLSPDAWISSGFGYRRDPINGTRRFHEGIDIVAPRKTPVIAPAEGVVVYSGWREGLGRTVEIRHGYGYHTTYGHNEKLIVKKGDRVERGDTIAFLGSSGRSTGPHLHYEVRLNDKLVNPYSYLID